MIHATFEKDFSGFSLSGHAGYAEAGEDIVCAAVSSMTNLVCNAADAFGAVAEICENGDEAYVSYRLQNDCEQAKTLIEVFCQELKQLSIHYPSYVRVKTLK